MSTLLNIDSIPLYGRSASRELTAAFVTQWRAGAPGWKGHRPRPQRNGNPTG